MQNPTLASRGIYDAVADSRICSACKDARYAVEVEELIDVFEEHSQLLGYD